MFGLQGIPHLTIDTFAEIAVKRTVIGGSSELPYWWNQGCFVTFWGFFPCEVKDIIFTYMRWDWTHARWDWNEHQKMQKSRKNSKFLFGWRGHLVTIFDQFTFFRYSTAWTISKHSSGTIIDKICKHSLKFHCTIPSMNQWTLFKYNINQTNI